jgi:hypothetical protein
MRACGLDHEEIAGQLEQFNEEVWRALFQRCGNYVKSAPVEGPNRHTTYSTVP